MSNVHEIIDRKWTDLQPNDDEREIGEIGEAWIMYETNGFGLDFVKKM